MRSWRSSLLSLLAALCFGVVLTFVYQVVLVFGGDPGESHELTLLINGQPGNAEVCAEESLNIEACCSCTSDNVAGSAQYAASEGFQGVGCAYHTTYWTTSWAGNRLVTAECSHGSSVSVAVDVVAVDPIQASDEVICLTETSTLTTSITPPSRSILWTVCSDETGGANLSTQTGPSTVLTPGPDWGNIEVAAMDSVLALQQCSEQKKTITVVEVAITGTCPTSGIISLDDTATIWAETNPPPAPGQRDIEWNIVSDSTGGANLTDQSGSSTTVQPGPDPGYVEVEAQDSVAGACSAKTVIITAIRVDAETQSLPEETDPTPHEEDPGALVRLNDSDLVPLAIDLDVNPGTGELELSASAPNRVAVWTTATKDPGTQLTLPKIWNLGQDPIQSPLYIEGTGASTSVGDTELLLTYRDPDGNPVDDDKIVATVMDLEIVACGDYIVPGSSLNTIQYTITPPDLQFDSVKLEVVDSLQNVVRTMTSLPTANGPAGYAEHQWNGKDGDGPSASALTSTGSPYTYRLTATKNAAATIETEQTEGNRQVIAFYMTLTFSDTPSVPGATVSGIDAATVTADKVEQAIQPSSDTSDVQYLSTSTVGADVDATLQNSSTQYDYFLFYTTPTTPYPIRYTHVIAVQEDGALDHAANVWDMDGDGGNGRQTVGTWEYGIDASGDFINHTEQYQ